MTWWVVEASPGGVDPESLARALVELTGQTALEGEDRVVGYAESQTDAERVRAALRERFGAGLQVTVGPEPAVDWTTAWRNGLGVREVAGLRLGPSWLLEPGPGAVVVDPETAFGSGEHGSTRGALTLLARHLVPGGTVIDLGSGSGILAIAAIRLGARSALGIENDPEAVPVAEVNAGNNLVADRIRFVTGEAAALAPLGGPADIVVSNILRHVNETLLGPIASALAPAGVAVFAGMETVERAQFLPTLAEAGFRPVDEIHDEGWWSVAAVRA